MQQAYAVKWNTEHVNAEAIVLLHVWTLAYNMHK